MLLNFENMVGKIREIIPKFTINHKRFCCAIEKISETYTRPRTIVASL